MQAKQALHYTLRSAQIIKPGSARLKTLIQTQQHQRYLSVNFTHPPDAIFSKPQQVDSIISLAINLLRKNYAIEFSCTTIFNSYSHKNVKNSYTCFISIIFSLKQQFNKATHSDSCRNL